jgi:hypothetical protein
MQASLLVHRTVHTPPRAAGKQSPLAHCALAVHAVPSPSIGPPPSLAVTQWPPLHIRPPLHWLDVVHSGPRHRPLAQVAPLPPQATSSPHAG